MTDQEIIVAFRRLMNTGKLDQDTLWEVNWEMQGALGSYPLASACVEDIFEAAEQQWSNSREELVSIVDDAAASIARHWEGYRLEVQEIALDYIAANAAAEGIELRPITTVVKLEN